MKANYLPPVSDLIENSNLIPRHEADSKRKVKKEKMLTAATTIQFIQTNLVNYVLLSHNELFRLFPEAASLEPFFGANIPPAKAGCYGHSEPRMEVRD